MGKSGYNKLNDRDKREIIRLYEQYDLDYTTLGLRFNVSPKTISRLIKNNLTMTIQYDSIDAYKEDQQPH